MTLDFESFSIDHIGEMETVGGRRFAWTRVYISLTDPATAAHPSAEIEIPIQYENDETIEQVRQTAFDKAFASLQTMCSLFERHGLQGMQQLVTERAAAEAAEVARLQSSEFSIDE